MDEKAHEEVVVIPEGVAEIENEAFIFREDICEVRPPSTLKRIGCSAFQECVNLKVVHFPQGLEEVGEAAFCNCLSLPRPQLPKRVIIEELAFHGTEQIEEKGEKT